MKKLTLIGIFAVVGTLGAQETPRFSFAAGAGFTAPVGRTSNIVDKGWNLRGSAGINFTPHVGLMLDAGYDSMGVSAPILNNLGFGGGNLSVFSLTLNPIVHLTPNSNVDL